MSISVDNFFLGSNFWATPLKIYIFLYALSIINLSESHLTLWDLYRNIMMISFFFNGKCILGNVSNNNGLPSIESGGFISSSVVGHPLLCFHGWRHTKCILRKKIFETIMFLVKPKLCYGRITDKLSIKLNWLCSCFVQVCAPAGCCPLSRFPLRSSQRRLLAVRGIRTPNGPGRVSPSPGWEGKMNGTETSGNVGWPDGSILQGHFSMSARI